MQLRSMNDLWPKKSKTIFNMICRFWILRSMSSSLIIINIFIITPPPKMWIVYMSYSLLTHSLLFALDLQKRFTLSIVPFPVRFMECIVNFKRKTRPNKLIELSINSIWTCRLHSNSHVVYSMFPDRSKKKSRDHTRKYYSNSLA